MLILAGWCCVKILDGKNFVVLIGAIACKSIDGSKMKFDWDTNKAASNLSKHGVSFEEAETVFDDSLYVDFYDPEHSVNEERYLIVGESKRGRLLIVSYTERGDSIRLISARELTRLEREIYEER